MILRLFFLQETELQGWRWEEGGQKLTNSSRATSLHSSREGHSPCSLWNDGSLDLQYGDSAEKPVCRSLSPGVGWEVACHIRLLGALLFKIRLCILSFCYASCSLDQNISGSPSSDSEPVICWMIEEQWFLPVSGKEGDLGV